MADDVLLNAGSGGKTIAAKDVSGVYYQRVILHDGTEAVRVTNGGLDINVQDQHTRALDLKFGRSVGTPTTLDGVSVVDAYTLDLTDATGFVDGTFVGVVDGVRGTFFATQLGAAAGNTVTLDTPIDKVYADLSVVLNLSTDMVVDGSSAPVMFQIGPVGEAIEVDITRIMGYMQDGTAMDDSLFGGISALTRGCVFRISNSEITNMWNVKTNGDLALIGFNFEYTPKAPAGKFGGRFRITYGGQEKHGVTLRLGGAEPFDTLELIVQDDLTDLEVFNMMAQGHVVED